jgi:thiol-disulfide isomerase/thioredoxin
MNDSNSVTQTSSGRRAWMWGAGAVALCAGAGAAWWGRKPSMTAAASQAEADALWAVKAEQPDGSALNMTAFRGRPLLVNFWATWCPPCVEELPMVDSFFREQQGNGWQVVGLALDKPAAVQAFLAKTPVSFPVGILGMGGMSVLKAAGNTGGGLPFTIVLDPDGTVQNRKMGQITLIDLQDWASKTRRL